MMRLKNILMFFLAVLSTGLVLGQKKMKLIKPAIDAACDCMDTASKTGATVESEMENCIVVAFAQESTAFMEYYDLEESEFTDSQRMEEVGVDFAMLLINDCPAFLEMAMGMDEAVEEVDSGQDKFFEGTFSKLKKDDFIYVSFLNSEGFTHTFILSERIDGDDLLLSEKEGKYLLEFDKVDMYSPKTGEFEPVKVLRTVEMLD